MVKIQERRVQVLKLLRQGKTQQEIAETLGVHRNTVYRDMKWLKANIAYDFNLLTNEILDKLQERIETMKDANLIYFLSKLIPSKIETKIESKSRIEIHGDEIVSALDKFQDVIKDVSQGKFSKRASEDDDSRE